MISFGNNSYGHPNGNHISSLKDNGFNLFFTNHNYAIEVKYSVGSGLRLSQIDNEEKWKGILHDQMEKWPFKIKCHSKDEGKSL